MSHLNNEQKEAVMSTEGPLLILAGAGSGKTTVLIERIAQIIGQGTPPWAVLAITFTNKAAGELKERLMKSLGSSGGDVWAATFHSACVRILRKDIDRLGYENAFTIYDRDDSKRVVKAVLKVLNLDEKHFDPGVILGTISRVKDLSMSPRDFEREAGDYFEQKCAEVYAEYQKRLKDANALDFDDIILLAVRLLKENRDILEHYQKKFSYILVDEYQDTNPLQYELVSMLAAGHRNICVVGDDDQSIYRFRGATVQNILSFEKQYPEARVIRLEQNYRSTGSILEAANSVIKNNKGRKGKTLWTGNEKGEPVTLHRAGTDGDEGRFIAGEIKKGVNQGRKFKDFCVLYRTNAQSGNIERFLKYAEIPYRIIGGTRFFDRMEVRDMLAYLQVLHNPHDNLRLLRIINNPPRGIGAKTAETALALAEKDGISLFEIAERAKDYGIFGRTSEALGRFASLINSLRLKMEELPLDILYDVLLEETGYLRMWMEKDDIESEGRIENILELKSAISQHMMTVQEANVGSFLDEVALFTDIEKYDENADAAILMTMHSSKGLEFPVVFIAGAEENLFPSWRSANDEAELEEERRLCYVAATRARERLYVIHAEERMMFGQMSRNAPSRFIDEMGLAEEDIPVVLKRESVKKPAAAPKERLSANTFSKPRSSGTVVALPLKSGDMVEHKSFGTGFVTNMTPMGGDALVEVAFDTSGTKRLMLKSASQFMKKLDN